MINTEKNTTIYESGGHRWRLSRESRTGNDVFAVSCLDEICGLTDRTEKATTEAISSFQRLTDCVTLERQTFPDGQRGVTARVIIPEGYGTYQIWYVASGLLNMTLDIVRSAISRAAEMEAILNGTE